MQDALNEERAKLGWVVETVARHGHLLGFEDTDRARFCKTADELRWLGEVRRTLGRDPGWLRNNPDANTSYKAIRDGEDTLRSDVKSLLAIRLASDRSLDSGAVRTLRECMGTFDSIAHREQELFRARRAWGRRIADSAREVFDQGSGNQLNDLANSGNVLYREFMDHVENSSYSLPVPDVEAELGRNAVIAAHFGVANCGHLSHWIFTEANRCLPGTFIAIMSGENVDHMVPTIGPPDCPESVYCDAWPVRYSITNYKKYGLKNVHMFDVEHFGIADGRNLRALGASYVAPLPARFPAEPPLAMSEALYRAQRDGYAHTVYHIGRTSNDRNSDSSDSDGTFGHALGVEGFTATGANNFTIQNRTSHVAAMRSTGPTQAPQLAASGAGQPSRIIRNQAGQQRRRS